MRIWRFRDPDDPAHAVGGQRGTWADDADGAGICPECTAARVHRTPPLLLAWEPGPATVGDFLWPGLGSIVVGPHAAEVLGRFPGWSPGPIRLVEDIDHMGALPAGLPATAAGLTELWVDAWAELDSRSTAQCHRRCATCGREQWELSGVEQWESHWDTDRRTLLRRKTERVPNAGLFVPEDALGGAAVFRVRAFPTFTLCLDTVRAAVEAAGLSNVSFLLMGETV